jgi:hypothetical protein
MAPAFRNLDEPIAAVRDAQRALEAAEDWTARVEYEMATTEKQIEELKIKLELMQTKLVVSRQSQHVAHLKLEIAELRADNALLREQLRKESAA